MPSVANRLCLSLAIIVQRMQHHHRQQECQSFCLRDVPTFRDMGYCISMAKIYTIAIYGFVERNFKGWWWYQRERQRHYGVEDPVLDHYRHSRALCLEKGNSWNLNFKNEAKKAHLWYEGKTFYMKTCLFECLSSDSLAKNNNAVERNKFNMLNFKEGKTIFYRLADIHKATYRS